jgi:hypothetical protein
MLDPENILERANRLHASIINEIRRPIKNFESVPKRATIRAEYMKCGKSSCRRCNANDEYEEFQEYEGFHGPYYVAYYRDKKNFGKLKKKYIGKIDPRNSYFKEFLKSLES